MTALKTSYLGIELKNPIIVSSSGLTSDTSSLRRAEENQAAAVVLKSLFQEQIIAETEMIQNMDLSGHPEAYDLIGNITKDTTLDDYISLIKKAKKDLTIPIIGSINCVSSGDWVEYAKKIEDAGADALELNLFIPPLFHKTSKELEDSYVEILNKVLDKISLPISVKIGSYFTNIYQITNRLANAGASGIVLFNRFYNPDININTLKLTYASPLSHSDELPHVLRWIALLSGTVETDFAATTGVHSGSDVIKSILAGASAVEIASVLYKKGFEHIPKMLSDIKNWMAEKNFQKLSQFKGILSEAELMNSTFERFQYIKALSETANSMKYF